MRPPWVGWLGGYENRSRKLSGRAILCRRHVIHFSLLQELIEGPDNQILPTDYLWSHLLPNSQIMAFSGGKDGSYILLRCFKSIEIHLIFFCFTFSMQIESTRDQLSLASWMTGGSPSRKMILQTASKIIPGLHGQHWIPKGGVTTICHVFSCDRMDPVIFSCPSLNGLLLFPRTFSFTSDGKSLYFLLVAPVKLLYTNFFSSPNSNTI